jgi:hypothetical protein
VRATMRSKLVNVVVPVEVGIMGRRLCQINKYFGPIHFGSITPHGRPNPGGPPVASWANSRPPDGRRGRSAAAMIAVWSRGIAGRASLTMSGNRLLKYRSASYRLCARHRSSRLSTTVGPPSAYGRM